MRFSAKKYLILLLALFIACSTQPAEQPVGAKIGAALGIKDAPQSPFNLDTAAIPAVSSSGFKNLPIGVFDSGTGGLTVLEEILKYDEYNNQSNTSGSDGVPDLIKENFVYFGDMANMPYGVYPGEGKTPFLEELCVKDGLFLINSKYHTSAESFEKSEKLPAKVIVIACNTGTAYGQAPIEQMIEYAGLDIDVIGVVPSGAKGALEHFEKSDNGTVGVLATVGTVSSEAYPDFVRELAAEGNFTGTIDIVQQGGFGMAESIDSDPDYIDRGIKGHSPRDGYIGPGVGHEKFPIRLDKFDMYNFAIEGNEFLYEKSGADYSVIQLNSVRNYTRFHVTELVLKMQDQNVTLPLRAIILGCTHYPYEAEEISNHLKFLAEFRDASGTMPFAELLAGDIKLVDPAVLTARETYLALERKNALNDAGSMKSQFFISTPNRNLPGAQINDANRFVYDYKYGRQPFYAVQSGGEPPVYVLRVPMKWSTLNDATIENIRDRLPVTYDRLNAFNTDQKN